MKRAIAVVVALLLGSSVCAQDKKLPEKVLEALSKADKVELFSLNPDFEGKVKAKDGFHGWPVLGQTELKGDDRKKTIEALEKGVPSDKGGARCFIPRHAIRAQVGKETVELVICFECSWIHIHTGDKREIVTVRPDVQPTLDAILTAAKVPLPKAK